MGEVTLYPKLMETQIPQDGGWGGTLYPKLMETQIPGDGGRWHYTQNWWKPRSHEMGGGGGGGDIIPQTDGNPHPRRWGEVTLYPTLHCHPQMILALKWAAMRAILLFYSLGGAKAQDRVHKPQLLKRKKSSSRESNPCRLHTGLPPYC